MLRGRGHAEKGGAAAGASANTVAVQRNWAERDFVQGVQVGVAQLTAFLNDFEATTRSKLAALDGKLSKLERRMDTVEATLHSVDQGQGS